MDFSLLRIMGLRDESYNKLGNELNKNICREVPFDVKLMLIFDRNESDEMN
jgi:hypothetical protein